MAASSGQGYGPATLCPVWSVPLALSLTGPAVTRLLLGSGRVSRPQRLPPVPKLVSEGAGATGAGSDESDPETTKVVPSKTRG